MANRSCALILRSCHRRRLEGWARGSREKSGVGPAASEPRYSAAAALSRFGSTQPGRTKWQV